MRVVTWNVNSLKVRMPRVLELLEQHQPDVLCLQETKCNPGAFPELELQASGYESVDASGGRWAGVAILARKNGSPALREPQHGLPGDPVPDEARWVEATAAGIRFASVYVPNGRTLDSPEYPRKLAFLEAMARRIAELQARGPLIVCGDMNIAPADADVYDPAAFVGGTHVSAPERDHLTAILEAGMVDAYRALHPAEVQFTWWDYRAGNFHKGIGLRIDLALVSASLAPRLIACGIYRDYRKGHKPSDHAPLVVDL
ncbi:MAG: exodeoxyribonuclease III [Solirubrobacteraceae bacterium]